MFRQIAEKIGQELSGFEAKNRATDIHKTDRYFSFDKFRETSAYCAWEMMKMGLEKIEVLPYKADGHTAYGDWIIPRAWDAKDAILKVIEPSGSNRVLARYRDVPCSLIAYSAPTPPEGIETEVVLIEDGRCSEDFNGKDISGKIILTFGGARNIEELARQLGAIGIIQGRGRADEPEAVPWENYSFGSRNEGGLFGFSLSTPQGIYLRDLVKRCEVSGTKVKVWVKVDTKLYDGTLDVVTATIKGDEPNEEVLSLAHLYEEGANDNASGSGVLLEVFRTLSKLISEGSLPRPKRTMRILLGMECGGFTAYCVNHKDVISKTVAAINPDMVGEDQELCRTSLRVHLNPHSNPSFVDTLIKKLITDLIVQKDHLFRWRVCPYTFCDNFIADPMIGIPTISMMNLPERFYHSSLDTADKLSAETLRKMGVMIGTYLYFIANAGEREALWLSEQVGTDVKNAMAQETERFIAKSLTPSEKRVSGELLQDFRERMGYVVDRGCTTVQSAKRLPAGIEASILDTYIDELKSHLKEMAEIEYQRVEKLIEMTYGEIDKQPVRSLTPLEEKASKMVPERITFGSLTLQTLPPEGRQGYRWKPGWAAPHNQELFWVDGKRTLLEIYHLAQQELGEVSLEELMGYFEFLAKFGYMKIHL